MHLLAPAFAVYLIICIYVDLVSDMHSIISQKSEKNVMFFFETSDSCPDVRVGLCLTASASRLRHYSMWSNVDGESI